MPPGRVIVAASKPLHDSFTVPAALTRYRNGVCEASLAHLRGDRRRGWTLRPGGFGRGQRAPPLLSRENLSLHALGWPGRVLRLSESRFRERKDGLDAHGERVDRRGK